MSTYNYKVVKDLDHHCILWCLIQNTKLGLRVPERPGDHLLWVRGTKLYLGGLFGPLYLRNTCIKEDALALRKWEVVWVWEEMGGVAWTEEEDYLLKKCIQQYGEGKWHRIPLLAGNLKFTFSFLFLEFAGCVLLENECSIIYSMFGPPCPLIIPENQFSILWNFSIKLILALVSSVEWFPKCTWW